MNDSCDISFTIVIIILITFFVIILIYFIQLSSKKEPIIKIENLDEPRSKLKRNEALVYTTKIPFINKYWYIRIYENRDADKRSIANDISNGDFPNTDVNDKLCLIITSNKYLYDMIVRKFKNSEYLFKPIFINETENEYYI